MLTLTICYTKGCISLSMATICFDARNHEIAIVKLNKFFRPIRQDK